jgi:predicted nuclease of restriction endonuclease-like RecB superfamily
MTASVSEIRLFDDLDRPWIASLLELVSAHLGKPWRVLLDRIEHSDLEIHPSRVSTIVRALRRITGGKAERSRVARAVRAIVLGHPALDADERDARVAAAAAKLGLPADEIEPLLWADLAMERPVTLPDGPPRIDTLLAFANLDRIQRSVRKARAIRLRVAGPANDLVRTITRFGLISTIRRDRGDTVFEITGPIALFHSTTVYGRALAQLVPLLAEQADFHLEIDCEFDGNERMLTVAPPVQLPTVRASRNAPTPGERLARELAKAGYEIDREPPPIEIGDDVVFPELAITVDGRHRLIEIVGFSTAAHLTYKLERYAAANVDVVLCVDVDRSAELLDDPRVVPFKKRIDAALVVPRTPAVPE